MPETTKNPITLIGERAGVCWGADISNSQKNYERGLSCIESNHGRTLEYVNVEMVIDGYSAGVIREWYTHIGGSPTRLQESTRYIEYEDFDYIIPPSIQKNAVALSWYELCMNTIKSMYKILQRANISKEDIRFILPLGMTTKVVDKRNLRNLIDMSSQRMCNRAHWEYRKLFADILDALSNYSDEWRYIIETQMKPKCERLGYCPEKNSCKRMKGKNETD